MWVLELIHWQYRFTNPITYTIILVAIFRTLIFYVYSKNKILKFLLHSLKCLILQDFTTNMNLKYSFVKYFNALFKLYLNKLRIAQIYLISYSLFFDKNNIKTKTKLYFFTISITYFARLSTFEKCLVKIVPKCEPKRVSIC